MTHRTLIDAANIEVHYPIGSGLLSGKKTVLRAVDGISLGIPKGEVLGLVGESGSGKSTLGRVMVALERPTSGKIQFDGQDIHNGGTQSVQAVRRKMQMVFQDPFGSLNPRMTIEQILTMPLRFNGLNLHRSERRQLAIEALNRVGMTDSYLYRYPHEFSGGQRQRIGIARALIVSPDFIVADEPVSALDVSVQAQVLNLFSQILQDLNLTMLFIAHDLAVVGHIADRVAVMYLGRIVEIAPTRALFERPRHPYTEALLSAAPDPSVERGGKRIMLSGEIPSPINPPSGCPFRTRCPYVLPECAQARPELQGNDPAHQFACIRQDLKLSTPLNATSASC